MFIPLGHRPLAAALLLVALFPGGGCGTDVVGATGDQDVLLVTIDTLRRDFVGVYGHGRGPTPGLDRLAADGVVFGQHYTVMAHTAPAHATMFSGLPPLEHGMRLDAAVLDESVPLLAEAFQAAGYRTAAVVGVSILGEKRGLHRGFEEYDDDISEVPADSGEKSKYYQRPADAVVDRALEVLLQDEARPLFLWVHLYDPHQPHEAPAEHAVDPLEVREFYAPRAEVSAQLDVEDLVKEMAGYEGEVRFADAEVERLVGAWDRRSGGANSIVCVTSDHGEGLGEHQLIGHGLWNYEEQIRVPLIVRLPGNELAGTRVPTPTSHLDLGATLLELAGIDSRLPGKSLVPYLGEGSPRAGTIVFAERRQYRPKDWERRKHLVKLLERLDGAPGTGRGEQTALLRDGWKYIWSEDAEDELYDLVADPAESRSVLDEHPERARELRLLIEAWRAAALDQAFSSQLLQGADVAAELENLGYLDAVEDEERE